MILLFSFSFIVMQGSCGITKLAAQKDMDLLLSVISRYLQKKERFEAYSTEQWLSKFFTLL
jgi:hypothetical protein